RATAPELRQRYFRSEGREFVLEPHIGEMVAFEERSLRERDPSFWFEAAFDAVFCRNVLIYFDAEIIAEVIERFSKVVTPGGFLFLGHSESLRGVSAMFEVVHTQGAYYY